MKKFAVVEFLDNGSVSVVPSSWISKDENEQLSSWPTYKDTRKISQAIQRSEEPMLDWLVYRIKLMKDTGKYII